MYKRYKVFKRARLNLNLVLLRLYDILLNKSKKKGAKFFPLVL